MRASVLRSVILLVVVTVSSFGMAEECVEQLATWGYGTATALAVADGILAVGQGTTLLLVDVGDGVLGEILAEYRLPQPAQDIAFDSGLVYLAVGSDGVLLVDVSDPAEPVERSRIRFSEAALRLELAESGVLVATPSAVSLVDFSDPLEPSARPIIEAEERIYDVAAEGELVAVVDGRLPAILRLVNFEDPERPLALGTLDIELMPNRLVVHGGLALISYAVHDPFGGNPGGIVVVDVTDPSLPVETGRAHGSSSGDLTLADGRAYVVGHAGVYSDACLRIIDVGDPSSPTLLGAWPASDAIAAVAVTNDHVFVGDEVVHRIDGADPGDPQEEEILDLEFVTVRGMARCGRYGYLSILDRRFHSDEATEAMLLVVDFADEENPRKIAELDLPGDGEVGCEGDLVLVASHSKVHVVDVRQPEAPVYLDRVFSWGRLPALFGRYAYDRSTVLDLNDPLHPRSVDLELRAYELVAQGDRLYGLRTENSEGPYSLVIFDRSSPLRPVELGAMELPVGSPGMALGVWRDLVLVASPELLQLVDVSVPSSPWIRAVHGFDDTRFRARNIQMSGGFAFVSTVTMEYESRVEVVDIRIGDVIVPVTSFATGTEWPILDHLIEVKGSRLMVADYQPFSADMPLGGEIRFLDLASCVAPEVAAAEFGWFPLRPRAGQPVQFFDQSAGFPDTWGWEFGDGSTASGDRPEHRFSAPGEYSVSLLVSNEWGSTSFEAVVEVFPERQDHAGSQSTEQ